MKWRERWRCHGSIVCCQVCDDAMCNSPTDRHLLGRLMFRYRASPLWRP
jgi:hypothetical protein